MSDPLERHTLLIPTFNRPDLMKRLVGYYSNRAPQLKVLVLDSSTSDVCAYNSRELRAFEPACSHMAFSTTTPIAAKLFDGLSTVRTPYVSFCADDDLVLPDAIGEAVTFLTSNPDFVAAHGLYLNYFEEGEDVRITVGYNGQSNSADHAGARIFRLCQNYESLFYAAFRTSDLLTIFKTLKTIPTLHYQELFQSTAALIKGKAHRVPRFYGARRMGPAAEPERKHWQTAFWIAEDAPGLISHYFAYRDVLLEFYRQHGEKPGMSEEEFLRACDISHAIYFSHSCLQAVEWFFYPMLLQPLWPDDALISRHENLLQSLRHVTGLLEKRAFVLSRKLRRTPPRKPRNPGLADLNAQVHSFGGRPWNCVLGDLEWLAQLHDFRGFYLDLCLYLEGPSYNKPRFDVARERERRAAEAFESQRRSQIELGKIIDGTIRIGRKSFPLIARHVGALERAEVSLAVCEVWGWAADGLTNAEVSEVVAAVGGAVVARTAPSVERLDIAESFAPAAKRSGFRLSIPMLKDTKAIEIYAILPNGVAARLDSGLESRTRGAVVNYSALPEMGDLVGFNWTVQNPDRGQLLLSAHDRLLTGGAYQFARSGLALVFRNFRNRRSETYHEQVRAAWRVTSRDLIEVDFGVYRETFSRIDERRLVLASTTVKRRTYESEVILLREELPGTSGAAPVDYVPE